jgi:hypothetical protein
MEIIVNYIYSLLFNVPSDDLNSKQLIELEIMTQNQRITNMIKKWRISTDEADELINNVEEHISDPEDWYERAAPCRCSWPCSCNSSPIVSDNED